MTLMTIGQGSFRLIFPPFTFRSNRAFHIKIPVNSVIEQTARKVTDWLGEKSFSSSRRLPQKSVGITRLNPVFLNAEKFSNSIAVIDTAGTSTYADILHHGMDLCHEILHHYDCHDKEKLDGQRIALLTENNVCYIIGQYATWFAGGISVPLCQDHPLSSWEYFLENSGCTLVLTTESFSEKISVVTKKLGISIKVLRREQFDDPYEQNRWYLPDFKSNSSSTSPVKSVEDSVPRQQKWFDKTDEFVLKKPALIIYTSGTTGRPKGVVLTHGNLSAMAQGMVKSWEWSQADVLLHVLPLHHVHGVVNCLHTPLTCGATCFMEPKFDPRRVWNLLTASSMPSLGKHINLFMGVPTIYAKLIQYYHEHLAKDPHLTASFVRTATCNKVRLMVSGSAALPSPVSDGWFEITGHRLLERYGMTEIGMALTNPLHGDRVPGAVGNPFPDVEVRIVKPSINPSQEDEVLVQGDVFQSIVTTNDAEGESGDLQVRGPSVFKEYWKNPKATQESFTKDGWFKTGDTSVYENGMYRIIGRTSVDIIKSGGYKISALDVERHLLAHPDIVDCAVVGLPDITWGQRVAAVLSLKGGRSMEGPELKEWARDYLPPYQIPTVVKCLPSVPRNQMGKVNKKELVADIFPEFM